MFQKQLFCISSALYFLICATHLIAASSDPNVLSLRPGIESYAVGAYIEILEDKKGVWNIDDVASDGFSGRFYKSAIE
ncbi:hypothetical protein KKA14_15170, partial [bacterium]|nr:hypothetical protein [bacterium]